MPTDSITVKVNGRVWTKVDSLAVSKRSDLHFILDQSSGLVVFGNGLTGKRPAQGAKIEVSYKYGSGGSGNVAAKLFGVYRGLVVNNIDPQLRLRLMVQVPDAGVSSAWASSCTSLGSTAVPKLGTVVWVTFEGGNAARPVWLGVSA